VTLSNRDRQLTIVIISFVKVFYKGITLKRVKIELDEIARLLYNCGRAKDGGVAQLGEHYNRTVGVRSSSLLTSTI
jgi:hypothetical protein